MQIAIRYVWPAYLRDRLFGIICCLFAVCGLTGISSDVHAIEEYTAHGGPVKHLDLSPDGRLMALWDGTPAIRLYTCDGEPVRVIPTSTTGFGLCFSRDGRHIASGGSDAVLQIWTTEGQLVDTLMGHTGRISRLVYSPSGNAIATASFDHTVRVWRSVKQETCTHVLQHSAEVLDVSFSPSEPLLACACYDKQVWRNDTCSNHKDGRYRK